MHIISNFKDFYDYLQFSFGQDDNIYWDRNFIDNKSDKLELDVKVDKYKYNLKRTDTLQFANNSFYYFNYISILGKSYPIVFKHLDNNFKSKFLSCDFFIDLKHEFSEFYFLRLLKHKIKINDIFTIESYNEIMNKVKLANSELLLNLSYTYKQPIFMYRINYYSNIIHITNKIPNLTKYNNLVSVLDPIKLYKDIYNFFINIYNDTLNVNIKEIDNKTKIEKAGFDAKKSFRK